MLVMLKGLMYLLDVILNLIQPSSYVVHLTTVRINSHSYESYYDLQERIFPPLLPSVNPVSTVSNR